MRISDGKLEEVAALRKGSVGDFLMKFDYFCKQLERAKPR